MNIFLLWQGLGSARQRIDPGAVATRLHRIFSPLFDELPSAQSRCLPAANLVSMDLPVGGFKPAAQSHDDWDWAYAPQYPINATTALASVGVGPADGSVLPALGRALEAQAHRVLRELAPPFSLIWGPNDSASVFVQTDGLGHAMLYEYRDENIWALTNRPFALSALGTPLEPDAEEWAVRSMLGWFPGTMTGFRNMRYLPPGTQLCVTPEGVCETRHDVLTDWIRGGTTSRQASLELAKASLVELVESARPLVNRPYISVSGGWDSRAVLAAVAASGLPFDAKVRGPEDHRDVMSARRLAAAGGFDLEARHSASLPPADHESCRARILRALIWQAGGRNAHKHKTFQVEGRFRDGGSVGFSGQHGEIGRSSYMGRAREKGALGDAGDDALLAFLTKRSPRFMRPWLRAHALEAVREAIRAADRYGVTGLRRWDFFYLFERSRRWAATAQAAKPGFSITPFLNPGYISAAYAYPDEDKTSNPFHRHIVASLQPAWSGVPYADEIAMPRTAEPRVADVVERPRWQRAGRRRFYDTGLYWEDVGKPVLADALGRDGFWTEVFDPPAVRADWRNEPDELAVVCLLPEALALASS